MTNTEYKELFKAVVAEEFKRNLSRACVHQSLCGKIFEQGMSREECKVWINNKDFDKFFKEIRQKVLDTIQNMQYNKYRKRGCNKRTLAEQECNPSNAQPRASDDEGKAQDAYVRL